MIKKNYMGNIIVLWFKLWGLYLIMFYCDIENIIYM